MTNKTGLTKERLLDLKQVNSPFNFYSEFRSSLRNMSEYVKGSVEEGPNSASVFLHNKITIDNQFLDYCDEKKIKIETHLKDPIASWKSSASDTENFVATGIFKIIADDLSFWHAALFHKGNQYEDEVSFFVVVEDDDYEKYINFRNDYTQWIKDKDRSNLEIEVIGGDPIEFERTATWDDVFLEDEVKQSVISAVDGFLKAKEIYKKKKVPWKKGLIFWGKKGNGKTTVLKIIMSQYPELKPVTVQPGHADADMVIEEAFLYAEEHSPSLLFLEDLQELMKSITHSHFLQLLDGVKSREGLLVIATGNDLRFIEDNITDRPGRFDRIIEFPLPNKELTEKYLIKWFGDDIVRDIKLDLVNKCHKCNMTFSHLQEIYFHSVDLAITNNREDPNKEDIEKAFSAVKKSKGRVDKGLSATEKTRALDSYLTR